MPYSYANLRVFSTTEYSLMFRKLEPRLQSSWRFLLAPRVDRTGDHNPVWREIARLCFQLPLLAGTPVRD